MSSQKPRNSDPSLKETVLVSTILNDVPGYQIVQGLGTVFGQTTASTRGIQRNVGAELKAMGGGEIKRCTTMIREARSTAVQRMIEECSKYHGNAVIAMRFKARTLGKTSSQSYAYGMLAITLKLHD